ncbi:hypothetical protein VTI74DRAFT_542 [Chaetomium olivicolor]
MLLRRMAFRLSLLWLATWTILPAVAAVAAASISDEILNFVPPCAQTCFESFISNNFDARICGSSPSLQCLCRQRDKNGYTVGEGGMACVSHESRVGACQGVDAIGDAQMTAYNMCVGVSRAAPKTHETISASLIVPPSSTGALLIPTVSVTRTATGSSTATNLMPSTTVTLSTDDKRTSSSTATSSSSTTPPTSPPIALPTESDGQPKLSSAQIVGITLGCVAVLVFGILLVLLARCIRRKRFGDPEWGFSRVRDSMSFGRKSRPGSVPAMQISSPIHRVQAKRDPLDPRWHPQIPPWAVGLAITPMSARPAVARGGVLAKPLPVTVPDAASVFASSPARQPSPHTALAPAPAPAAAPAAAPEPQLPPVPQILLRAPTAPQQQQSPPKPTLTLAIPKAPATQPMSAPTVPRPLARAARVPANGRDSVVTEFAEDGEGDSVPAGSQIWRPPPTDPQSATTYFMSDKAGNWVLRSTSTRQQDSRQVSAASTDVLSEIPVVPHEAELPSPDHRTRAERAKDAYGGFLPDAVVSPLRLPRKQNQAKLGSPIAFKDQRRQTAITSPPSSRLSFAAETVSGVPSPASSRSPGMYFTMAREPRDLTGGKIKRRSATRRTSRRISQDSVTSIESALGEEDIRDEAQLDLSPVAESPQTPISPGKSPVKYPKIRKDRGAQPVAAPTKAPEPGQAPPMPSYNVWHPPGALSATGSRSRPNARTATPSIAQASAAQRPWNAPSLNPTPNRNPGQMRTGSPDSRGGTVPRLTEQQYWQRQQQVANPASYWNHAQKHPAAAFRARPSPPAPPTPPYELPAESAPRRYVTPPPQQYQQQHQQQRRPLHSMGPNFLPTPAATPGNGDKPGWSRNQSRTHNGNHSRNRSLTQLQTQTHYQNHSQPQAQPQHQNPTQSQHPHHTQPQQQTQTPSQSQSSLLAKRRGADKVSALTLGNNTNNTGTITSASGAERRGTGRGKNGWMREEQGPYGPVPITPGWVPELTPTRRGEDLVLNVR